MNFRRYRLHRRFSTVPGAQAQVGWGDEGDLFGIGVKVHSFHMVLSFSTPQGHERHYVSNSGDRALRHERLRLRATPRERGV